MKQFFYRVRSFPSQLRFYHSDAKYSGFSGPVGSGKTYALCYKALRAATANPGCTGLLGAPTIPMLRSVTLTTMLELLEKHRIPFTFRSQSASLFLPRSRSKIVFRPLEYFDRLRGYNLAWFGIDELTYCREGAWQVLQQRIRDPRARKLAGFAVWTPKGFDWVYDRFISPTTKLPGHEAILAGPRENIAVLARNPNYYEDLKAGYDSKFYQQEAEGAYLNIFSGRVYHAYEAEKNDVARLEFNPSRRLNWALDFNIDPMSSVLCQEAGGAVHVLDELSLRGASINDMCARFIEQVKPLLASWREVNGGLPMEIGIYGDAAANSGNHQTRKSDYDNVREYFRSQPDYKLIWCENKSNPPVKDRCASVNRMLCDALGHVRIFIDVRCRELRTDLLKVTWKRGAEGFELDKKSDPKRTHMTDALGYHVWADFRIGAFKRVITTR